MLIKEKEIDRVLVFRNNYTVKNSKGKYIFAHKSLKDMCINSNGNFQATIKDNINIGIQTNIDISEIKYRDGRYLVKCY